MAESVPRDVYEWIGRHAPFSKKKSGARAVFSEDNTLVQRRRHKNDWGGCVCYTLDPLPLERVWQITIHKAKITWGAIGIGMVRKFQSMIHQHF